MKQITHLQIARALSQPQRMKLRREARRLGITLFVGRRRRRVRSDRKLLKAVQRAGQL